PDGRPPVAGRGGADLPATGRGIDRRLAGEDLSPVGRVLEAGVRHVVLAGPGNVCRGDGAELNLLGRAGGGFDLVRRFRVRCDVPGLDRQGLDQLTGDGLADDLLRGDQRSVDDVGTVDDLADQVRVHEGLDLDRAFLRRVGLVARTVDGHEDHEHVRV